MMTFSFADDQVLRVRQRSLLGPVTIEVLGPVRDVFGTRPAIRKIRVPAERMAKLLGEIVEEEGAKDGKAGDL